MKYFTLKEMLATSIKIKNFPGTWEEIENLILLTSYLDKVRMKFKKPIRVNSGYRTKGLNVAVGGVYNSDHIKGLAADIVAWSGKESDNRELLEVIKELGGFDQLISYHKKKGLESSPIRFIHVGLNGKREIILKM